MKGPSTSQKEGMVSDSRESSYFDRRGRLKSRPKYIFTGPKYIFHQKGTKSIMWFLGYFFHKNLSYNLNKTLNKRLIDITFIIDKL